MDGRARAAVNPPPELSAAIDRLFADRRPLIQAYAELLGTVGVERGLIGPRETGRVWERHILNCAVVGELIPAGASVTDVGSGAGLPGIVLAVARPDLSVTLVEPLARRTVFLTEAVEALALSGRVTVVRGRAEELLVRARAPRDAGPETYERPGRPAVVAAEVVTARAVAPLGRLAKWCLPLAVDGGRLLALKGASAMEEIATYAAAIDRLGGAQPVLRHCGAGLVDPPATVVEIVRRSAGGHRQRPSTSDSRTSRSRQRRD
jgi:16S rRNA (guanine527-N7)-methyltransferase